MRGLRDSPPMTQRIRSPWGPLAVHLVLLGLVLILALALSERSTGFTTDEGSYAIQAEALHDGSWSIDWPFRAANPSGDAFPYHGGVVSSRGEFSYVSHPAWPLALSVMESPLPKEIGLRVLPMLGVLVAAASAYVLALRLADVRSAAWSYWLVVGSPILVNGLMIWAHAPAAAVAGVAAICLAAVLDRQCPARLGWSAGLLGCIVSGALLRSEFVLLAIAIAVTLAVAGLVGLDRLLLALAAACGAVTVATVWAESLWIGAIVGSRGAVGGGAGEVASRATGSGSWLGGRLTGLVTSVLKGATNSPLAAVLSALVIVAVAFVVVDPTKMRISRGVVLWGAVALTVARLVIAPDEPAIGMIAAWPLALLVGAAWRQMTATERWLLGVVAIYALGVFVTQYDDGGGLQWGGRFLGLAVVPLAVFAARGVDVVRSRVRGAAAPLLGLIILGAAFGLIATNEVRLQNAASLRAATSTRTAVILVPNTQFARLDWNGRRDRCWIYVNPAEVGPALDVLTRAGVTSAGYVLFDAGLLRSHGLAADPRPGYVPNGTIGRGGGTCPATR